MLKKIILLSLSLFFVSFCNCSDCWAGNYGLIDRKAINAPISLERNMTSLVAYLTKGNLKDDEKARAIAVWIASRVDYDDVKNQKIMEYIEKNKGFIPNTGDAFVTRKGVCIDFAILFQKMATEAGLKTAIILGYAGRVNKKDKDTVAKHAWNAVKLDGYWYLLDVTWASVNLVDRKVSETQYERDLKKRKQGSVSVYRDSKMQAKNKLFQEEWFLTSPSEMIKTHFPDDSRWQLLYPKVSASAWFKS